MLSLILSSCPPAVAQSLAEALVDRRVAACVSTVPGVLSVYRWQGQIARDGETLLLIKTAADQVEACMAALRELHPYSVPEMVEVPAARVWEAYLQWAVAETRPLN